MAATSVSLRSLRLKAELLYCRQGVLPFIAAALLLLTVLFAVLVVPGQIAAKDRADKELARLAAQQAAMRGKPDQQRMSPARSLARVLSDPQTTSAQLRTLLDFAAHNGVTVMQADYRRIAEGRTNTEVPYSQLQISLPVKSDYLSLRRFIYEALAEMPSLSLDQLVVKREQANGTQVDAQLVFSLWQRSLIAPAEVLAGGSK